MYFSDSKPYQFSVPTGYHFYAKLNYDLNPTILTLYLRTHNPPYLSSILPDRYDQAESVPNKNVGLYNCDEAGDVISVFLLVKNVFDNSFSNPAPYTLTTWMEPNLECSSTRERALAVLTTTFSVIAYEEIQRPYITVPFMGQCEQWDQKLFNTSTTYAHVEGYVNVKRNWIILTFKGKIGFYIVCSCIKN